MSLRVQKLGIVVADIVDFGTASGVSSLVAGSGVSLSPASGIGTVTVTNAGVVKLLAGTAISLSPAGGTGTVTVAVIAASIIDTITPTTVGATGQTAGVNTKASASDHKHQLDAGVFDSVNPALVGLTGQAPGTLTIASRRDHKHQLDTVSVDSRYVLKAGDTMTGALILALADSSLKFQTSTDTDPEFQFHLTGIIEWGIGAGAGPDMREQIIRTGNDRLLRLLPVGTGGIAAYEVQESSGNIRRFVTRSNRAGVEDQFGTHLNDIERTRFTLQNPYNSVGASTTVVDLVFFVANGLTVKVWFLSWFGASSPTGTTFIELVSSGVTILSQDTASNGSSGDPSTTAILASSASTGQTFKIQRRNTSAKTAFSYSGLWVLSIE